MRRLIWGLALVGIAGLSGPASGHGFAVRRPVVAYWSSPVIAWAPPRVVYYPPVVPAVVCPAPQTSAIPVPFATPSPAPPSKGKLRLPAVRDSEPVPRSNPPAKTPSEKIDPDRCQVGFWNVTGRDLTLTVAGERRRLPRGRSVTLNLGRRFDWQVDGGTVHSERVPAERATLEIVLR
jgi:hypothetical protein